MPGTLELDSVRTDVLTQFCLSEDWSSDLSSGIIRLGRWSATLHGAISPECGLLSLVRCYETYDRARILELFEQAATSSSNFCFSTTALVGEGHRQPVFCVGESIGTEEKYAGSMAGVFLFPRFKLEPGIRSALRQ